MTNRGKLGRKLKFGQVGGGRGSFIGETHRRSASWNGLAEFAAGALASTPEAARQSGEELLLPPERNYGTWGEMLERESALPEGERIDFVSIVTPNHVHYEPALAFVEAGFNVIVEKPMVHNSRPRASFRRWKRTRSFSASPTTTPAIPWSRKPVTG